MKIVLNEKGTIPNSNWSKFVKVRAIIENQKGEIAITHESNKTIFPGGTCENNEDNLTAIKRELKEELGIDFDNEKFSEELTIETFYEDYYDFRIESTKPRHTITTYFYVKTNKDININEQNLTKEEINQQFKIFFTNKNNLIKLLQEDHSSAKNGKCFDEENLIVLEEILKKKFHLN